jgi:hypothetical protein
MLSLRATHLANLCVGTRHPKLEEGVGLGVKQGTILNFSIGFLLVPRVTEVLSLTVWAQLTIATDGQTDMQKWWWQ